MTPTPTLSILQKKQISTSDICLFMRHFAALLTAGVSVSKCFDILEKSQNKPALRHLIFTLKQQILSGRSLFATFRIHQHFDDLTCQLIYIGEQSGKLDTMFTIIANTLEKNLAFKKRVRMAMFYPCIITLIACAVTLSMFLFVIPRFAELFQDAHLHLPLLTRILFYISIQLRHYVLAILMLIPGIYFVSTITGWLNHLKKYFTSLVIVRSYRHKILLARFVRNLAITYSAGIPVTDALKITIHNSRQDDFVGAIYKLQNKVSSGLQLHSAMQTVSLFPTLLIQMVKIGEESGKLDQMLDKTAEFFEADLEHLIERFNQMLEPLIMLVLGVLIGVIMIGMYLPIFKLGSVL